MIERWNKAGAYAMEAGAEIPYDAMREFFADAEHKNDVIKLCFSDGRVWYANKGDVENQTVGADCFVPMEGNFFREAYNNPHLKGGIVPIINDAGEPVYFVKEKKHLYDHSYECDPALVDVSIMERYDGIILYDFTEYSYLILSECVPKYSGEVILEGERWTEFLKKYPAESWGNRAGQVRFALTSEDAEGMSAGKHMMKLGLWERSWIERNAYSQEGRLNYEEILFLLYFFADAHGKTPSDDSARRKFMVIDSLFDDCAGIGTAACYILATYYTYAASKGFIPVFSVTSPTWSPYIDVGGEDFWEKFFDQPSGYSMNDIDFENDDVRFVPKAALLGGVIETMRLVVPCAPLNVSRYLNQRCREYVDEVRKKVIGDKKNILGIFIRGGGYTGIKSFGHAIQATPEQVLAKAAELGADRFSYIYVTTEDTAVLELMKREYGDRLLYMDRTYFDFKKGGHGENYELNNKLYPMNGWLRGVEYLASLELLADCDGMVASGYTFGMEYIEHADWAQTFCPNFYFELGLYDEEGTHRDREGRWV